MNKAFDFEQSESRLVQGVSAFLAQQGYRVRAEVPSLGQSADLVATRGRWVTFVEVKVRDWQRAIEQCQAHRLVADFICIAIGTKGVSDAARRKATAAGIGIIHIASDGSCDWTIRPVRNRSVWLPQRRQLSAELRAIEYAR